MADSALHGGLVPARLRTLTERIGRRGASLLLFGLGYVFIGLGQTYTVSPQATLMGLTYILRVVSIEHWGLVWIGCGIIAMGGAFTRRPGRDLFGFVALAFMAAIWAAAFLMGAILLDLPRAALMGAQFAILATAVAIIAGWPEPPPRNMLLVAPDDATILKIET